MPPQFPDDNELVMNMMFMLSSLHGHGMNITDMNILHTSLRNLAPFAPLRGLFGQTREEVFHLRITGASGKDREVTLFVGTHQMCVDQAKTNVINLMEVLGHTFRPINNPNYWGWQSQHYVVYIVPKNFKL